MNEKPHIELLVHLNACLKAIDWAREYASLGAAWNACRRPSWMLWLVDNLGLLDDKRARRYACRCVRETPLRDGRTVWDLLTDERSRQAVIVAEQYCEGLATAAELEAAWGAARDVRGAVCAWAAAETASRPIRGAVAWSGAWAAAESAAWIAAETTSWAVQGSGAWDVVEAAQSVILRTLWTTDEIEITARAAIEKVKEWNA